MATADQINLKVGPTPYLLAQLHLGRVWRLKLAEELTWFLQSMRGELPPHRKPMKNYVIHHVFIPSNRQYLMALEALTTRLGVKI